MHPNVNSLFAHPKSELPKIKSNNARTVVVTGGSSGIGLATVEKFASEGYGKVFALARNVNRPELVDLVKKYPNIHPFALDVTSSEEAIQEAIKSFGKIDIFINNAGSGLIGTAESFSIEQIRNLYEVNYFGPIKLIQAILPGMRAAKEGAILNVSSCVSLAPDLLQSPYSGSKAALEHFLAQINFDLYKYAQNIAEPLNIRIANINPGFVSTNFKAPVGSKQIGKEGGYSFIEANIARWNDSLHKGQSPADSANLLFELAHQEKCNFWNSADPRVLDGNAKKIYHDPTGNQYSHGVSMAKYQHLLDDKNNSEVLSVQNEKTAPSLM